MREEVGVRQMTVEELDSFLQKRVAELVAVEVAKYQSRLCGHARTKVNAFENAVKRDEETVCQECGKVLSTRTVHF